jgi:hypothetical protein
MAEQKVIIDNQPVNLADTKTVISLSKPTPSWVNWVFRTEFVLNKVVLFLLGSSALFTPNQVKEAVIWIAALDMAVWGLGRFVGMDKKNFEDA